MLFPLFQPSQSGLSIYTSRSVVCKMAFFVFEVTESHCQGTFGTSWLHNLLRVNKPWSALAGPLLLLCLLHLLLYSLVVFFVLRLAPLKRTTALLSSSLSDSLTSPSSPARYPTPISCRGLLNHGCSNNTF